MKLVKVPIRLAAEAVLKVYLSSLPRAQFNPRKVSRILVFAYHGLGNFIMYTPALKLLRQRYPSARIDLQVGNNTGCEEVLAGSGLFDAIVNIPYSAGLLGWLRRAREIRNVGYDLTINEFHSHSWPLALLVAVSAAPFRLGHVTSPGWSRRFSHYSFMFNLPVVMREDEHEIERYLDLVSAIEVDVPALSEARTSVYLTDEDREFARRFLEDGHPTASHAVIGFQPGTSSTMRWKQWPVERYRQVIERVASERPDSQIVLFGSASEEEMIRELTRGLKGRISIAAGKTSVKQVAALIERCNMLVCNDSGLMHTAVAVGTPVVAIYGPTDIRRTAPLGKEHVVIRHELPCSPCFKLEGESQVHECPHHDCLMTITPGEVHDVIVKLARNGASREAQDKRRHSQHGEATARL